MEFCYKLTIWECIVCGIRRASGRLFHIPFEIMRIYERCGKKPRTVRIEEGSVFVIEETDAEEYQCRNIQDFRKKGTVYWIVMAGRMGNTVQLHLPTRVVGDAQAQNAFWRYLNDQRRISGDKLVMDMRQDGLRGDVPDAAPYDTENTGLCQVSNGTLGHEWYIIQKWNLDKRSRAVAEFLWIQHHYMTQRRWKDWGAKNLPSFLAFAVMFPAAWYLLNTQTIPIYLALSAMLGFRTSQEWSRYGNISIKDIRNQVEALGRGIYQEEWELLLSPEKVKRKIPQLKNVWGWELVGFLIETDDFYFFFTKQQRLMFYVEKALFGDWLAQKLFVQECQHRGARYQALQPKIVMDFDMTGEELSNKILPITKRSDGKGNLSDKKQNRRRRDTDTQEGWRTFWERNEKGRSGSDKKQVLIVVLGMAAAFLFAFFLPEYGGRQGMAGVAAIMDLPAEGEAYVFHPESYKDYMPLAKQVEVLETLGFLVPEELVAELNTGMEEVPMYRVWVEGYPYRSLLMGLGTPERDYETWEMKRYPEQAYWFDWEGFDMSNEYIYILNGVNAMANGEFMITDAEQDMSDDDWERGSGIVHVRFCVDGIPYEYQMALEYDWLDAKIIGDINDAIKNTGIENRVYAMADGGQGCILMYGDKEWAKQFQKATGIKLETE